MPCVYVVQAGDEVPPGAHSADAPAGLGSPPSGQASVAQDMPNEAPGQAPPGAPGEEATAPGALLRQYSTCACMASRLQRVTNNSNGLIGGGRAW